MSFCTTFRMLSEAQREHYAVPAINIDNMEMALGAIKAAENCHSPIIIQTTPLTIQHGSVNAFAGLIRQEANAATVPIALHLDHGNRLELLANVARSGFSSLMIDGSSLSFEDNVALTEKASSIARFYGLPLEAELGRVGGNEDAIFASESSYTDPEKAIEFVERTGITSLAVSIGTAHGIYKGKPHINLERLAQIRSVVSLPLVLHGASGLEDEVVKNCIAGGICKVNFATEIRMAFTNGIKDYFRKEPDAFDPKAYSVEGMNRVCQRVEKIIELCGSSGKAVEINSFIDC